MTKMSDLTNEQIAAKVAVDVMGWREVHIGAMRVSSGSFVVVDHDGVRPPIPYLVSKDPSGSVIDTAHFDPLTNASHDYLVLQRVRQTWSTDQKTDFCMVLRRMFHQHYNDAPVEFADIGIEGRYSTGDYARAALAVMENNE